MVVFSCCSCYIESCAERICYIIIMLLQNRDSRHRGSDNSEIQLPHCADKCQNPGSRNSLTRRPPGFRRAARRGGAAGPARAPTGGASRAPRGAVTGQVTSGQVRSGFEVRISGQVRSGQVRSGQVLCCAVLCCAVLCCAVLSCAVLRYAMICCNIL